jgi:DNA-binding LacI/PurR family transcriptional regulator
MPLQKIGAEAVETLLKSFIAEDDEPMHGTTEVTSLLVRGSTAKAKA